MGTFHLGECCFSVGGACSSDSYGAAFATTARKKLLFYCSFERLPDGDREPVDRDYCRCWVAWERRVSWEISRARDLDPLRRLVNGEKGFESHRSSKRSRRHWRRRNLRILWRSGRLYSQTPCPFWQALAKFGRHRRHRTVQHLCRAIGSFLQHCMNQWPCSNTALLKKAWVIWERLVFSICVLNKRVKYRKGNLFPPLFYEKKNFKPDLQHHKFSVFFSKFV